MPKSPSRTSKKKKYNARFPPARIKKIMQTDEEVGKVAAAVPVIISRALELFIESLITETSKTTVTKNAKTLSTSHIKQTIETNKQFDFLRDLVASVPDHQAEDNGDMASHDGESSSKKGRGRPRKLKEVKEGGRNRGESSKTSSNTSEEEEDDEEDEDEDTETDEEGSVIAAATSSSTPFTSTTPQGILGNSQDRLMYASMPGMSHSGTMRNMDSSLNMESSMTQPLNNLAVGSVQQHPYQQQYSSLPSYNAPPYPPFMPNPSQGMTSYPIPPQFHNCYTPMMPSSQLQFQPHALQNPGSQHPMSNNQQFHTEPHGTQTKMQPQAMNLSYASRAAATTANENDDYDT